MDYEKKRDSYLIGYEYGIIYLDFSDHEVNILFFL